MIEYRPQWKAIVGVLALLAVLATAGLYAWSVKDPGVILPVALSAGGVSTVLGFAWWLFNNHAWKWKAFHWLAPQPNISGRWEGVLRPPFTDALIPVAVEIRQRFVAINCQVWTASNRSASLSSSLLCTPDNHSFRLLYTYDARALPGFESAGDRHMGTVLLELVGKGGCDGARLAGWYFTDRDAPAGVNTLVRRGEVYLCFDSPKLQDKFGDVDREKYRQFVPPRMPPEHV